MGGAAGAGAAGALSGAIFDAVWVCAHTLAVNEVSVREVKNRVRLTFMEVQSSRFECFGNCCCKGESTTESGSQLNCKLERILFSGLFSWFDSAENQCMQLIP